MDVNEAYRKGQRDMRHRIEREFWRTDFYSDFQACIKKPPEKGDHHFD